jgi:hypothetical protein
VTIVRWSSELQLAMLRAGSFRVHCPIPCALQVVTLVYRAPEILLGSTEYHQARRQHRQAGLQRVPPAGRHHLTVGSALFLSRAWTFGASAASLPRWSRVR